MISRIDYQGNVYCKYGHIRTYRIKSKYSIKSNYVNKVDKKCYECERCKIYEVRQKWDKIIEHIIEKFGNDDLIYIDHDKQYCPEVSSIF